MDKGIEQQHLGSLKNAHTQNKTQSIKLIAIAYVGNCQHDTAFILHRALE